MKIIRFGKEKEFHLLDFRLVQLKGRKVNRLHSRCGVRVTGEGDKVLHVFVTEPGAKGCCKKCLRLASASQKRQLGIA